LGDFYGRCGVREFGCGLFTPLEFAIEQQSNGHGRGIFEGLTAVALIAQVTLTRFWPLKLEAGAVLTAATVETNRDADHVSVRPICCQRALRNVFDFTQ
jgi:hypothetical protein